MRIAYLALKILAPKARHFENSTKKPIEVQKKLLFQYLHRNKNTEYGVKYHFSHVKSIGDYRMLVPMSDSETIFPYVEKIKKGTNNILTKDKVVFFGLTSGTTGKPKFIPVTNFSRKKKAEVMDLWAYYILKDHRDALDGKVLAIINPDDDDATDIGIPVGAESGHAYKNMPRMIKKFYAVPYNVFMIQDYESRYYCIARIALEKNVTTIATLNPSTIVLLCHKIEKYKDELIEDIEKGTLSKNVKVPPYARNAFERTFRPNKKRADELKNILKEKKELLPKYFWPNLKLIECWKGGTVKLYLRELPQYFGGVPIRDFGCLSTEARSSIPMSDTGAGGVLAINTNFYEFIPKEDIGKSEKRFLLCDELEKAKEYYLIVTTPGGLYRYNIDDIITVTGFYNRTPVIEFVQKGLNAVSIMGEKLYESQVNEAVNRAADKHKLLIAFFSACAQWNPPRYIFLVEFGRNGQSVNKQALLRSIEEELGKENSEYKYVRDSQLLKPPVLKVVKAGEFEKYRVRRVSEGANDSQFKVAELTANADFEKNFAVEEEICLD
ncbi:MAG: GH3 auxin-responsive promoter family protein [Candidatus Omnitrophota bacterium]|nr:GH3 auxin-responsive promoter family protein [Candidatus Omnitrophota bacterium]